MGTENLEKKPQQNNAVYKSLARNTFYSFLLNYGSLFSTFINSFLLARLITDIDWGILILVTSYITIVVIITTLIPPGQDYSLNYYVPRYLVLNKKKKLKSLIKNTIILKLLFLIPIFIISILIFTIFIDVFATRTENHVILLYLLSPLIIINSLERILNAINQGLSRFKFIFLLLLVKYVLHLLPLYFYYVLRLEINIETIGLIIVISSLIPFILNFLSILIIFLRIKPIEGEGVSFKENFNKNIKYGTSISFSDIIQRTWREAQLQGIGIFEVPEAITGYSIALNYRKIGIYSVASFHSPLMTCFTSLNTTENYKQVRKIFIISYKITLFLLLIIAGILFFSVDFMLDFIFLEQRLKFASLLRLTVLASIFIVLESFVRALINAQNKSKFTLLLKGIEMSFYIPLFFIGLIYFGVEGALIFGFITGNIISLIMQFISANKIGNIKLDFKNMVYQYLAFFIPLGITMILEKFIFKEISFNFIQDLGLSLFKNFDFLSIGTFLILFIFMNLVLNTVSSTEIIYFESLLDRNRFLDKIMLKGLNVVKIFTRK